MYQMAALVTDSGLSNPGQVLSPSTATPKGMDAGAFRGFLVLSITSLQGAGL